MSSRRAKRALAVVTIAAGALFVAAGPASAHVGVTPSHLPAGASTILAFSFSHGCEGSPTTAITFELPPEIPAAKATLLAGWQT